MFDTQVVARRPIVERLNREIVSSLETPQTRERFVGQGAETLSSTPETFSVYLKSEIAKYAALVKAAALKID